MSSRRSIKELSAAIRAEALRLGFSACGFSRAEHLPEDALRLAEWIDLGHHAGMGYMARNVDKRNDPTRLVEGARSIISLLFNYYTDLKQQDPDAPVISKYAYGTDYHTVMKEKMHRLYSFIQSISPGTEGRVFVDSAPLLERSWAWKAGLGWIGRNSCLISRTWGSFVFIGELILNLELETSQIPEKDLCGSCNRCVESCPTGAILENRTIDSARCISYQTIENRDGIPEELHGRLSNHVFGCDICQDVCPWNRRAVPHRESAFDPAPGLLEMEAVVWMEMDRESYDRLFSHTPVQRAGFSKIRSTLEILRKSV